MRIIVLHIERRSFIVSVWGRCHNGLDLRYVCPSEQQVRSTEQMVHQAVADLFFPRVQFWREEEAQARWRFKAHRIELS